MPKPNPLADLLGDEAAVPVSGRIVPNLQPSIRNVPYRLAIIGEAPGVDEEAEGKPFVGYSGRDLNRYLSKFGILRDACFIGNVCQHRPPANKIAAFDWNGPEIGGGLTQLKHDLTKFIPNCILLLGGTALHAFRHPSISPKKRKTKDGVGFVFPDSISDWRGSFFLSHPDSPLPNTKCIAGYHPAACLRQYKYTPYLLLDILRASKAATTKELILPERRLDGLLSFEQTRTALEEVLANHLSVGTDIEGYWNYWRSISFAPSSSYAFVVPWVDIKGNSIWTKEEEIILLRLVVRILAHPKIAKIWQNGLYDRFAMQYGSDVITAGPSKDIMHRHWELYCELEKSLSVQCSIYTDEPYYKGDINSDDLETFLKYNCRDSAVTKEIFDKQEKYLLPPSRRHAGFNEILACAVLYMEKRGLSYDHEGAKKRLKEINHAINERQYDLDQATGKGVKTTDKVLLRALLRDTMCYKRDPSKVKEDYKEDFDINMRTLLGEGPLTKAELGRLSRVLGKGINVDSSKQLREFLYTELELPEQHDPLTKAVTCDYEALITLRKKSKHSSIPIIIEMAELLTRAQMLTIKHDSDGRIRSSYNLVGSETGRVTSLTSPTGSGYNLQTLPDENELKPDAHPLRSGMRDLVVADSDSYLAKCDLKGADGWTVGANLASCGDRTMLDDLLFGLKPANISCYESRHGIGSSRGKSRPELFELCKEVKKSDWDYFAYKQCVWGFCYLMGAKKAAQHVFNVSEGTVEVSVEAMEGARETLIIRYSLPRWWRAAEERLRQPYPPKFESPSGHIRKFFNRKQEVLGELLAHEPQSVTTYATNMAVKACWVDPENRYKSTPSITTYAGQSFSWRKTFLHVEPMHQVHDEFLSQFKIERTEWATTKIKQWFNNKITIAGIDVVIPYEGSYGTNWAMNSESKKGSF